MEELLEKFGIKTFLKINQTVLYANKRNYEYVKILDIQKRNDIFYYGIRVPGKEITYVTISDIYYNGKEIPFEIFYQANRYKNATKEQKELMDL